MVAKKDTYFHVDIDNKTKDVMLRFIKEIKPDLEKSAVPLIANEDFTPVATEIIDFFEATEIPEQKTADIKISRRHYAYISAFINFSNSQKPTESFLTEEQDDVFWGFIEACDDIAFPVDKAANNIELNM